MENNFESRLKNWATKVANECHNIATSSNIEERVDLFFYALQSPPKENPDLLIIGLNPGGSDADTYLSACNTREIERMTYKEIMKENPFWHKRDSKKRDENWAIWTRLKHSFINDEMFQLLENSVYMNLLYFNSGNFNDFLSKSGSKKAFDVCCKLTNEAISDVFKPKMIICLGVSDCFNGIKGCTSFEEFPRNKNNKKILVKKYFNDIPVYGIPHPSSARGITNEDRALIGKLIYEDFFKQSLPEKSDSILQATHESNTRRKIDADHIQEVNKLITDNPELSLHNDFLEIESNNSKTVRVSFKGLDDDILVLTITSTGNKYIGIRAFSKGKDKADFNSNLKHKEHYIELLKQLNFSADSSWLGCKAINDLELKEGSKETSEKLIESILSEVNKFREKLK